MEPVSDVFRSRLVVQAYDLSNARCSLDRNQALIYHCHAVDTSSIGGGADIIDSSAGPHQMEHDTEWLMCPGSLKMVFIWQKTIAWIQIANCSVCCCGIFRTNDLSINNMWWGFFKTGILTSGGSSVCFIMQGDLWLPLLRLRMYVFICTTKVSHFSLRNNPFHITSFLLPYSIGLLKIVDKLF